MTVSLSNDKNEITQIIKNIFKDINFKFKNNFIIICEILGLIQNYNLYEFYHFLKNKNNNTEIKSVFINREIKRKNNYELNKKFAAPGFQKLKEKKVQESITSIDFED